MSMVDICEPMFRDRKARQAEMAFLRLSQNGKGVSETTLLFVHAVHKLLGL
jgi:hypothetical protein